MEYEYEVGSRGVGIRDTVSRRRTHYLVNDIKDVCGGDIHPVMPRHIKFFLMRKMGLPTPLPWNLGDLITHNGNDYTWLPLATSRRHKYLVISIDDEFVGLFNLTTCKRETHHIAKILPEISQFDRIQGS